MIYDFPITRMSFNSAAFNYALACTKAALFLCMKYQDPRQDSEETSGTMHRHGFKILPFLGSCISAKRRALPSSFLGIQRAGNPHPL